MGELYLYQTSYLLVIFEFGPISMKIRAIHRGFSSTIEHYGLSLQLGNQIPWSSIRFVVYGPTGRLYFIKHLKSYNTLKTKLVTLRFRWSSI